MKHRPQIVTTEDRLSSRAYSFTSPLLFLLGVKFMLPSARLLKAARELLGLTQEELAAEAKVAKATVNRI
jgi:hypothetical protein